MRAVHRLRVPARRGERGAVAVIVAISFTAFVILVALVVDLGLARDTRRVSQNAADASALAGANSLYPAAGCVSGVKPCTADAVAAVKSYAATNFGVSEAEWTSCTATLPAGYAAQGGTSCIAFNNSGVNPTKVLVRIPTRNVKTNFAGIIGRSDVAVGSGAEAELGTEVKCSLCFLGGVEAENADFSVFGGSIAVNGDVDAGPNSIWTSGGNYVVGTVAGGVFTPSTTPISPFGDPMASLALPLTDASLTVKTDPCTQGPGIYNSPITLGNNEACVLTPGLYVVSSTWLIGNNTTITGTGVTVYVPSPGYLNWKNGFVTISAPTSGAFQDLAVVYARDNTNPISIQGNGSTSITGTVYAPAAALDFNGNSCFGFSGGPVVVAGVDLANGNKSCIEIASAKETTVTRTDLHLSQ